MWLLSVAGALLGPPTGAATEAESFLSLTVDNLTRLDPRYVFSHSDLAAVSTDIATVAATTTATATTSAISQMLQDLRTQVYEHHQIHY